MKKMFLLLLPVGLALGASAQDWRGHEGRGPEVRIGVGAGPQFGDRGFDGGRRIAEINSYFDQRIWQVRHDRFLTNREKRRAVRDLDTQREMRIREVRRFDRY
jgi:hypothetical protein